MPKSVFRKLFSRSPKLPATTTHLASDATRSAANAPPLPPPNSTPYPSQGIKFTHHSRPELENSGYIDASNKQNCNNVSVADYSIDNRVDQSVNINHAGTQVFNYNYLSGSNERSNEPSHKVHFMVPYSQNEGFIGISQTLAWLEGKIKSSRGRVNHHRVALWGMGGIGKTQDVLECIYHYQSSQSVFWVHGGSQLQFEKDYRKLAELVGLLISDEVEQDIRLVVKNWLEGPESGNWILVLDNADNQLDFFKSAHTGIGVTGHRGNGLAEFIPHGSKGTVIITTRDREVAGRLVGACNILDKTLMDSTDARQLFVQNYPKATGYSGNEDNSISLLLEALQYLPLAITQVAAYLHQNTLILPSQYLNLFRTAKKELLSKPFSDIRREYQSETVLTTFSISFRQLQEQLPFAGSLLQLMACIDNQYIPHELLVCSIGEENLNQIAQLQLVEAVNKLIAFGLLSISRRGKDYKMHSLVYVSINSFILVQERDAAVKQMVKVFRRIYPEIRFKPYDTWVLYLSHASVLVNYIKESCEDKVFIYNTISLLLLLTWNTSTAEEKAKQAVQLGTDILGPEHIDTLMAIGNLGWTYLRQGRLKEAEELVVQVIKIWKRVLGPEHPDTLLAIGNLASTYRNQGRLKEAKELGIQVMEARKKVLGSEHLDTLMAIGNLAATYRRQGLLKEAEELDIQVMEVRKKVLDFEHPYTLMAISNLAATYRHQGRLKEAEELQKQVMEARKRMLGPEHPDTLMTISNLAGTYMNQGHLKEAEELGVQVMEGRKRVLGSEHPDTFRAISNLASIYWNQGRLQEAEELEIQVMEAQMRVLGPEHPHTLTAIGNLAATYINQGRLKEAEKLVIQVVEAQKRVLGPDHPDTLLAMGNLALIYWNQGCLKEAGELGIQVMEAQKRVLGPEHPNTLIVIGNLAVTYRYQGCLKEAEELGIQVMEAQKRVLGPEHPDTLTTMGNLAVTYMNQERLTESEKLGIQVMEARKRVLGPKHPDTLSAIANLAATYEKQRRLKEAEELET